MTNCKNCPYTDEYCASGDCERDNDLTKQWKKGKLSSGWYYLKVNEELANRPVIAECIVDYNLGLPFSYFYDFDVAKIEQVIASVPTYKELNDILESEEKSHLQADSYYNKILELTDLLEKAEKVLFEVMDCREDREFYKDLADKYYEYKYSKYS